jgi:nicotinate-nucleotide pyrophosphorylase (carboxylating)
MNRKRLTMNNGLDWDRVDPFIEAALKEDLGDAGDLTTRYVVSGKKSGIGEFLVKQEGVIAGVPVVQRIFQKIDKGLLVHFGLEDGRRIEAGSVIGYVKGSLNSILKAERTVLNLLQRLSGVATLTAEFVRAIRGTSAKILDTRKTTPLLRYLERYAVRIGGGENHRFGLYDMILIKDNHIDAAGGLDRAVQHCLDNLKKEVKELKIEVETRTLEEVRQALQFPINRIMLDNMDIDTMRIAVKEIGGRVEVEASGNISLKTVRSVAETGVDFISIGALTHSVKAIDISLNMH